MASTKNNLAALQRGNGQPWPLLDLLRVPDTNPRAVVATGCRTERGQLSGLWPPATVATDGSGTPRGLAYHLTTTPKRLLANATRLYVDGTAANDIETGSAAVLAGSAPVVFAQQGYRTFFVDGSSAPRFYDERDGKVYTLSLPSLPPTFTTATSAVDTSQIHTLTNTTGTAAGTLATGWTDEDPGDDHTNFEPGPIGNGANVLHMDTSATPSKGSAVYYTKPTGEYDWSAYTELTFDTQSGGNEKELGLVFFFILGTVGRGGGGAQEYKIAYSYTAANTTLTPTISLAGIPTAVLQHVKYFGFEIAGTINGVFWWYNLRATAGARAGSYKYVAVRQKTLGTTYALELTGPETVTPVEAKDVPAGSKVRLTFASAPNAGETFIVARLDEGVTAEYHRVGSITSGTTFDDTTADASANDILKLGRSAIPTAATVCGVWDGRLLLYKEPHLWISAVGDPTSFFDIEAQDYIDNAGDFTDADGLKVNLGQWGTLSRIDVLGAWTGSEYVGACLLTTVGGWDLRLDHDSLLRFAVTWEQAGGCANPYAGARTKNGGLVKIEPTGDFALIDRQFQRTYMSEPLEPYLRTPATRTGWLAGYDPATDRAVFACGSRLFTADLARGGYSELTSATYGAPLLFAETGATSGGHLVAAYSGGVVKQVFDLTGTATAWTYRTGDWTPGWWKANAVDFLARVEGTVTATFHVQTGGTATATVGPVTLTTGVRQRLTNQLVGETLNVELAGSAGSAVHGMRLLAAGRTV